MSLRRRDQRAGERQCQSHRPGEVPRLRDVRRGVPGQRHHPAYHFTDGQIVAQLHALLADKPEEKVLAFTCRWCSGMGADNAGTSHFEYPANTRNILVMCAGRVDTDFVMEAFRLGAGAVLVSGCHPQDCHYITGRQNAGERMAKLAKQLERAGISPDRFRVESVSATGGREVVAYYARAERGCPGTGRGGRQSGER